MSDHGRVIALITALTGDPSEIRTITIQGAPASKSRPRFGKGGRVYTSAESRAAEKATAYRMRQAFASPMAGNVALVCIFFRPNKQRIDADNMLKHVCDAANGIVWFDDSQITSIAGIVELDADNPRTVVAIAPHATTMTRASDDTRPCIVCGSAVPMAGRTYKPKYCSRKCAVVTLAAAPIGDKECEHCKAWFKPSNTRQRICSSKCRVDWMTNRRKEKAAPYSKCKTCGSQLSHKRGGQCRQCWLEKHMKGSSPTSRARV